MLQRRDRKKALEEFKKALADNPNDSFSAHKLGLLFLEEYGDREAAEKMFLRAIQLKPHNAAAYCSLAAFYKKVDPAKAEEYLLLSLKYDQHNSRALKNLGLLYTYQFKDYPLAMKYLETAKAQDRGNASVCVCIGQMYEEQKRKQKARQEYALAITQDAMFPLAYYRLGKLDLEATGPVDAVRNFERAVRLCPIEWTFLIALARSYSALKNHEGVLKCARTAVKWNSHNQHEKWFKELKELAQAAQKALNDESGESAGGGGGSGGGGGGGGGEATRGAASSPSGKNSSSSAAAGKGKNGGDDDDDDGPQQQQNPGGGGGRGGGGVIGAGVSLMADKRFSSVSLDDDEDEPDYFDFESIEVGPTGPVPAPNATAKQLIVHCPIKHEMRRVYGRPVVFEPSATWSCEECGKSITQETLEEIGAWHCVLCKYELCGNCTGIPRSAHVLPEPPKCIAQGGFGEVYREYNKFTQRYEAVKHIPFNKLKSELVEKEFQLQKKFRDCPYIVEVYAFYKKDELKESQVHMELMKTSLAAEIKQRGPIHERECRKLIFQALQALSKLHTHNPRSILHRDIKPENLLLSEENVLKLSDFGLSKHSEHSGVEQTKTWKGTMLYLAPELVERVPKWTYAGDIWALGCTWLAMAYGSHPWIGIIPENKLTQIGWLEMIRTIHDHTPIIPQFLSDGAKAVLAEFLKRDYRVRKTADMLLMDPYFASLANNSNQHGGCDGDDETNNGGRIFNFFKRSATCPHLKTLISLLLLIVF